MTRRGHRLNWNFGLREPPLTAVLLFMNQFRRLAPSLLATGLYLAQFAIGEVPQAHLEKTHEHSRQRESEHDHLGQEREVTEFIEVRGAVGDEKQAVADKADPQEPLQGTHQLIREDRQSV